MTDDAGAINGVQCICRMPVRQPGALCMGQRGERVRRQLLIPAAVQVRRFDAAARVSGRCSSRHFSDGGRAHASTEQAFHKGESAGRNFCVLGGKFPAGCSCCVFKSVTGGQVKEKTRLGLVSWTSRQLADRMNCFVNEDELTLEG